MPNLTGPADATPPLSRVEKLSDVHVVSSFDCGNDALTDWLKRHALTSQKTDSARTYVVHRNRQVVGYYALTPGSVRKEEASHRVAKGMPNYPIGVILLARLAVNLSERNTGLGKALLKDALLRIEAAADLVSARAVLVHAIDEKARRFYEHFGFEPSPVNPFQLMLLMKDLRAKYRPDQ